MFLQGQQSGLSAAMGTRNPLDASKSETSAYVPRLWGPKQPTDVARVVLHLVTQPGLKALLLSMGLCPPGNTRARFISPNLQPFSMGRQLWFSGNFLYAPLAAPSFCHFVQPRTPQLPQLGEEPPHPGLGAHLHLACPLGQPSRHPQVELISIPGLNKSREHRWCG